MRPNGAQALHLYTQASRLAYADRGAYMADADFVAVPVEGLLDSAYLRRRAERISGAISMGTAEAGRPSGSVSAKSRVPQG